MMTQPSFECLKHRFFLALAAFIGICATLTACHHTYPGNAAEREEAQRNCEVILLKACTDSTIEIPTMCVIAPEQMVYFCETQGIKQPANPQQDSEAREIDTVE